MSISEKERIKKKMKNKNAIGLLNTLETTSI
jgi:hypothetical protein